MPESAPGLPPAYAARGLLFSPFGLLSLPGALFLWTLVTMVIFGAIVPAACDVAAVLPDVVRIRVPAFPPFWNPRSAAGDHTI